MIQLKSIYVTVGTTKFDALIEKIFSDDILLLLRRRGCKKITVQYGTGKAPPVNKAQNYGIAVEIYQFKFGPERTDIINSDLTIGHAGAGTCMDILKNKKPGLVVVNDTLMDNHQVELAEQLAKDSYIFQCNLSSLEKSLKVLDFETLVPYEKGRGMPAFISHLREMMRT
ncbi:UDP-N-acetylglucosamine transferase subunit ALG13 homolog [Episyrphus balteatus]|uniref:UDP-N-acetylglucosamine transferase subunit ALG13 homolog n=1 Tax=Episyrphus balteatus TaxID=286459 RepID=UPI002485C669|nr:UDP-N-acetylglucosamine transferase subunit ALG13 homolog [Episyrphus balteatus]